MIAAGVRSMVELNVRKGDVQGFSKLELTLPDGFIATPGEIKGASFTFSGDKAKFVWMNLPEEQAFTITYYIESEPGVQGAYEIQGTFSYVKENKREDIYVPTRTVVVKESIESLEQAIKASASAVRVEDMVLEMSCERRIERLADNEYLVKLTVNNNKIVGFGKILEILPDNCSTNRENDGGAVITQDANSIKFVWFEVPIAPSFEVSYRVMCISDGTVPVIRGQVSFTENGNPFTVDVVQISAPADLSASNTAVAGSTAVDTTAGNATNTNPVAAAGIDTTSGSAVNSGNIAANTGDQTGENNSENTGSSNSNQQEGNNNSVSSQATNVAQNTHDGQSQNDANATKSDSNIGTSSSLTAESNSSKVAVKSVPSAEKGVSYKVQILAAHRVVDKSYLKKTFSFEEDYNIEHHNGWVKYTTGSYAQYKDARDARVKITSESNKLPGPFVTAYNDGERITVQEALLISKQLWYK